MLFANAIVVSCWQDNVWQNDWQVLIVLFTSSAYTSKCIKHQNESDLHDGTKF